MLGHMKTIRRKHKDWNCNFNVLYLMINWCSSWDYKKLKKTSPLNQMCSWKGINARQNQTARPPSSRYDPLFPDSARFALSPTAACNTLVGQPAQGRLLTQMFGFKLQSCVTFRFSCCEKWCRVTLFLKHFSGQLFFRLLQGLCRVCQLCTALKVRF